MDGAEQSERRLKGGDHTGADDRLASRRVDWTRGRRQADDEPGRHANHHYVTHRVGGWHDGRVRWRPRDIFRFDGAQPWVLYSGRLATEDDASTPSHFDAGTNQRRRAKGRDTT